MKIITWLVALFQLSSRRLLDALVKEVGDAPFKESHPF